MTATSTKSTSGLRQDLQAVLGQLFELHVQGLEAHADFVGTSFTGIQRQLAAVVETARDSSRAVADMLRAFDIDSAAAANMIGDRISALRTTIRCVRSRLRDADATASALLDVIADAVGRQALMLATEAQRISSAGIGRER